MNHTHDFTINVLLVQLAFQFVAFMLWLHLSGLDGLRRERMIPLLEQRPIHITRVFRDEDSDEDSDSEDDEDFDNDDEVSDDEKDEDSDDEDFESTVRVSAEVQKLEATGWIEQIRSMWLHQLC